jgi:hypothetical protein
MKQKNILGKKNNQNQETILKSVMVLTLAIILTVSSFPNLAKANFAEEQYAESEEYEFSENQGNDPISATGVIPKKAVKEAYKKLQKLVNTLGCSSLSYLCAYWGDDRSDFCLAYDVICRPARTRKTNLTPDGKKVLHPEDYPAIIP